VHNRLEHAHGYAPPRSWRCWTGTIVVDWHRRPVGAEPLLLQAARWCHGAMLPEVTTVVAMPAKSRFHALICSGAPASSSSRAWRRGDGPWRRHLRWAGGGVSDGPAAPSCSLSCFASDPWRARRPSFELEGDGGGCCTGRRRSPSQ
jgi:hypothetical protein